jgi:hypothetical protein
MARDDRVVSLDGAWNDRTVSVFLPSSFPRVFSEWFTDWARSWGNLSFQAELVPLSFLFGPNFDEEEEPAFGAPLKWSVERKDERLNWEKMNVGKK